MKIVNRLVEFLVDKPCANHPDERALSACHCCGKFFCKQCLNEGVEHFYCNNASCKTEYTSQMLPAIVECPGCSTELELDEEERVFKEFTCPVCGLESIIWINEPSDYLEPTEYVCSSSTLNLGDIALIKSILDEANIDYHLEGDRSLGVLPFMQPSKLWVHEDQIEIVNELLKDFEIHLCGVSEKTGNLELNPNEDKVEYECSDCGTCVSLDDKVCPGCGANLQEVVPETGQRTKEQEESRPIVLGSKDETVRKMGHDGRTRHTVRDKPMLIKLGTFGSLFAVGLFLVISVVVFVGPDVTYYINEQEVSREVFQRFYVFNLFPFLLLISALLLLISYGFLKEKTWSKHLAVAYWAVLGVLLLLQSPDSSPGDLSFSLLLSILIPLGIAAWYFYFKPYVSGYYEDLAREEGVARYFHAGRTI